MSAVGPLELMLLLLWAGCAIGCGVIAQNKGRSGGLWALLGLLFGLFALLVITILQPVSASAIGGGAIQAPPPQLPPEGWYPNPEAEGGLRWWDGHRWTGALKDTEPRDELQT